MPQGFQNRFKYGHTCRSEGTTSLGVPFSWLGKPLLSYDAVFTYRSGIRSKQLSQGGNYASRVLSGSLSDQLRRRNEYLEQYIRDELTPTSGTSNAFCVTDSGHPFASYKLSATQPYASVSFKSGASKLDADVNLSNSLPWPNFADPFGNAITDGAPNRRFTYFAWPTTPDYISGSTPSLSNQIVSNAVKNSVAAGIISSANPWKPKASLAQTILELLTGDVPSVFRNLRRHIYDLQSIKKTAGSDWLNVQFGWVPLVSDIRATVEVLLKLHMLLYGSDSYRRTRGGDLGTWARVHETASSRNLSVGSPLNNSSFATPFIKNDDGTRLLSPPAIPAGVGKWSRTTRITADFRFSAKYHRGAQPNGRERGYIERATELLGLEITPAVLWELTPWTWLLDWGSNLGSVAANLSLLDWSNVLLDYAYLTFCVKTQGTVSWQGPTVLNSTTTLSHGFIAQGYSSIEKVREQASPYGFSVSWDGLSPFQLSILAALGMSRGR